MALVLRRFFSIYTAAGPEASAVYDFLLAKAALWVTGAEQVLRDSITSQHTWQILVQQLKLDRDVDRLMTQDAVQQRVSRIREHTGAVDRRWWERPNLNGVLIELLDAASIGQSAGAAQYVQIMHAAEVQIASGNISNYRSFAELADAVGEAIDALTNIDDDAKNEARSL